MAKLPEIASLWIGGKLSWLEQLCLKSFADAGHHTTLYSYEEIPNVPEGVHRGDAAEIFPYEPMYKHARTGSPAIHADLWRLNLLKKTDKIWVDADIYCHRPFNFTRKSVFGWEHETQVCNAVLGLPRTSKALNLMLEFFKDEYAIGPWLRPWQQRELEVEKEAGRPIHLTEQEWGFTGPAAVTYFLNQTGEIKYAEPIEAFYPVSYKVRNQLFQANKDIAAGLPQGTYGVHFWARRLKRRIEQKEDNARPQAGSYLDGLLLKHDIDPELAPLPATTLRVEPTPENSPELLAQIGEDFFDKKLTPLQISRAHGISRGFVGRCIKYLEKGGSPKPVPQAKPAASSAPNAQPVQHMVPKTSIGAPDLGLSYSEIIVTQGIKVPFVPQIITPKIERPMRNNRYEGGECQTLLRILREGDRVLDIGAGVGLVSTLAASAKGVEQVVAMEANPDLLPLIQETYRLNEVNNVELRNGVVSKKQGPGVDFYLRKDFWASSMEPESRAYERVVSVPGFAIDALVDDVAPTVISCDIEGAELGLFDDVDLSGVRHLVLELHPKVYGTDGVRAIVDTLSEKGFHLSPHNVPGGSVRLFDNATIREVLPEGRIMPLRSYKPWPVKDPNVLVMTCMKDEGPFILEWIAWNRALGVTDFLVYTNDCTDGTDALLDRLDEMGVVRHQPNPALGAGTAYFQPAALNNAHYTRAFKQADFVLSIDVDEFLDIRAGEGRLSDLFDTVGDFDVLSVNEINHGANGNETYQRGWVTDQFPRHESETPGKYKARRGVKSIVRLSERIAKVRNHRPDTHPDAGTVRWLDGSGNPMRELLEQPEDNGVDSRGRYALAGLRHFALRSVDSYLMKMVRGDVVIKGKQVSQRYWRARNKHETDTFAKSRIAAAARQEYDMLLKDAQLKDLHEACCASHEAKIADLSQDRAVKERRDWIFENAWDGAKEDVDA